MKYAEILQVAIASSFIFLSACTKDVSSVATATQSPPSSATHEREADEELRLWTHRYLSAVPRGQESGYVARGHTTPGKSNPIVLLRLNTEFHRRNADVSWEETHDFAQEAMPRHGVDPEVYDSAYSSSLTIIAMKDDGSPAVPRRDSVIEYWMYALVLYQGAKTKIMAKLAEALRPIVSLAKYNYYRSYVIDRANKDLAKMTPYLEEARERIESRQGGLARELRPSSTYGRIRSGISTRKMHSSYWGRPSDRRLNQPYS